jgi:hypothetical protein
MAYTETYCIRCYANLAADPTAEAKSFIESSQFVEEFTSEYNEPLIEENGFCFRCGRKGVVVYYHMKETTRPHK